ncbi:MAG: hypothetical protein IKN34_06760, partial [Treponema sp.]|nr:hypothetical protein [Treponema sp.]
LRNTVHRDSIAGVFVRKGFYQKGDSNFVCPRIQRTRPFQIPGHDHILSRLYFLPFILLF